MMIGKSTCILLAGAFIARAAPVADRLCAAGIAEFSAAYEQWDAARFGTAADWFRQAAASQPDAALHPAWQGAALFHQMLRLKSAADPRSAAAMDAAVSALKTAVKLQPADAESHALLGTLYGMKIDGSMLRAAYYGRSVQQHQQLALRHGATNPRVRYLLGTGQFHTAKTPADRREALATLLLAEKLFAAEAATPTVAFKPRWGASSCLTFIGRSYEALGQRADALAYYRKALAAHPADSVAKEGLARMEQQH